MTVIFPAEDITAVGVRVHVPKDECGVVGESCWEEVDTVTVWGVEDRDEEEGPGMTWTPGCCCCCCGEGDMGRMFLNWLTPERKYNY